MKKKLELQWVNKDKSLYFDISTGKYEWVNPKDPRVTEPRILIEKESYGDPNSSNMLIKGDNLLGLRSLIQDYRNKVKLIFIDPPYNTGNAFIHYDDGLEHSIWLSLLKDRLQILRELLCKDGSIWVSIDDNEAHYLKVLMDEIFGRENFVTSIAWRSTDNSNNDAKQFSIDYNSILVYSKSVGWLTNKLSRTDDQMAHYSNPDNDPRGPWFDGNPISSPKPRPNLTFPITSPNGHIIQPPRNGWRWSKETLQEKIDSGEIKFTADGKSIRRRTYLADQKDLPPSNLWSDLEQTGHNRQAKYEQKKIFPNMSTTDLFSTPKPEKLLQRIIHLGSEPGDLILDSFAGSGTTGAVAHKMKRKWIMIELGDHAIEFIIPRMKQIVEGKDDVGISSLVDWEGGEGFKYFELGESLFVRDDELKLTVINPKMYNGSLIRAVLKLEGFKLLNPDNGLHGISGTTVAHVTEQYLSQEYVNVLLNEVGDKAKYLVIYAKTISSKLKLPDNVEVKRMPDVLLKKFVV